MAPMSTRQAMVESELEARKLAAWLLARAPRFIEGTNLLEAFDSEAGQQFLEQHGREFAERLMRMGERLGWDRVAFAHGVSVGLMIGDALKLGQRPIPPINLLGPIESGET